MWLTRMFREKNVDNWRFREFIPELCVCSDLGCAKLHFNTNGKRKYPDLVPYE